MTVEQRQMSVEPEFSSAPKQLLLVDDEPVIVATLHDALTRAGFAVTAAMRAEEAIEHARRTSYSLAILDYSLSDRNGLEVAASFIQVQQPFMFLTAYSDESLVDRAVAAGALAYVVKPIDPSQLIPSVRAAVQRAGEITALLAQTDRLSKSITTNRDVSVAVGLLMAKRGVSRKIAYETLRQQARRARRPLRDLATEITQGLDRIYELPMPELPEEPSGGPQKNGDS